MNTISPSDCQECAQTSLVSALDRRGFFRLVGGVAVGSLRSRFLFDDASAAALRPADHVAKPTEELVREFHDSWNPFQRTQLVFPWNYTGAGTTPARLGVYNTAIGKA